MTIPSGNVPCLHPKICGVSSHKRGTTDPACRSMQGKINKLNETLNLNVHPVGSPYQGDNAPAGKETILESNFHGNPSMYVDNATGAGTIFRNDNSMGGYRKGIVLMIPASGVEWISHGMALHSVAAPIYQNSDGELWFRSNNVEDEQEGTPMKLSDLREGDRHSVQESEGYDGDTDGEHEGFELARRLYANPKTLAFMKENAQVHNPSNGKGQPGDQYFLPER